MKLFESWRGAERHGSTSSKTYDDVTVISVMPFRGTLSDGTRLRGTQLERH